MSRISQAGNWPHSLPPNDPHFPVSRRVPGAINRILTATCSNQSRADLALNSRPISRYMSYGTVRHSLNSDLKIQRVHSVTHRMNRVKQDTWVIDQPGCRWPWRWHCQRHSLARQSWVQFVVVVLPAHYGAGQGRCEKLILEEKLRCEKSG